MKKSSLPLMAGLVFAGVAVAAQLVPTPRATLLAATAVNRPFLAALNASEPRNLALHGYVEEEYLVSGNANVYEWAPAGSAAAVQPRKANVPYTTRLLLRRPADARKFSGRVIVELLDPSALHDAAPLWGLSHEHFLRQGDAWVGLTVKPAAARTLQSFDAVRYAKLGFAAPQPPECQPAANTGDSAQTENGLAWDIVAQAGALLRSSSKENPLAAFDVRRLIAAGYGPSGGYLVTYVNALHAQLRLGDGRPVYDGYLDADGAMLAAPINQCAAPLEPADPRRRIGPRDAPVLTVMTQTYFDRALGLRRQDSDDATDFYRLYEIAGGAQPAAFAAGLPSAADLAIAGLIVPVEVDGCEEAPSNLPVGLAFNAIWMQLDDYLVRGQPMQRAPPLSVDATGKVALDARGNALAGLRLPQLVAPAASYGGHSTPRDNAARQLCEATGSMRRFDSSELKALYGNRAEYLKQFNTAVDRAVADRWLVPADAVALKAQVARTPMSF